MSFSFDETLPTDLDVVRDALGDTDATAVLRSNERIAATLARYAAAPSPLDSTVASLAFSLGNEYRRKPSSFGESGGVSLSWADRVRGWDQIVRDIRAGILTFEATGMGVAGWQDAGYLEVDYLEPLPPGWAWNG